MPKPPKCTTEQLQTELPILEAAGCECSAVYIRLEIERRLKSSQNKGRPATNDTPRHKQWREASAKRRTKADKEANAVIAKTVEKLSKGKKAKGEKFILPKLPDNAWQQSVAPVKDDWPRVKPKPPAGSKWQHRYKTDWSTGEVIEWYQCGNERRDELPEGE